MALLATVVVPAVALHARVGAPHMRADEGVTTTTSLEAPSRRITRSMSRGESSSPSSLSLFCITLV